MVVLMACAVAAVYSVRAANLALRDHLVSGAREWLGGDLQVSFRDMPDSDAARTLDEMGASGTVVLQTLTMIRGAESGRRVPAALKAVETERYPLYGALGLRPGLTAREALRGNGVAVNPELLTALGVGVGGGIEINGRAYVVRAVILREADRWASMPNAFHHVVLSRESLEESGVLARGNGLSAQVLFRLGKGGSIEEARQRLERRFADADIADYRQPDASTVQALDQGAEFLALAAWLSVGAAFLAGGLLLHLHLEDRLDSFAALKVLGAGPRGLAAIAAVQAFGLWAVAVVCGTAVGAVVARVALPVLGAWLSLEVRPPAVLSAMGPGAGACLLGAALVFGRTLSTALGVAPMRLLRRHVDGLVWRGRRRREWGVFVALAAGAALPTAVAGLYGGVAPGLNRALPGEASNLVLVSPSAAQMEEVRQWLPGKAGAPRVEELAEIVWLRLLGVNGAMPRVGRMWFARCAGNVARGSVVVSEARAEQLGARVGDWLEFVLARRALQVRVAGIARGESLVNSAIGLEMACEDVADVPRFAHAGLRVAPEKLAPFRQELAEQFPTIVQISREELDQLTRGALRQGLQLVVAGLVASSGGCLLIVVLMAAAAARRQLPQTAILRALGASRRSLLRRTLARYGLLGLGAGLCGGLAGMVCAAMVLGRMLHTAPVPPAWWLAPAAAALTAVVALGAGWLAMGRALRQRPLETLREL
jgi:predicted lysophospholipase L1 biosynthesis ABC-type transport system permease subunit